jgi:DNA-nicking Smr family endonuclease
MNFGDILNEWDKIERERKARPAAEKPGAQTNSAFEAWLAAKGVEGKDEASPLEEAEDRGAEAHRLAGLRPQASLDLHGMFAEDAEAAIRRFIDDSARAGLEKVLIIHGKGLHSEGGVSVLKRAARRAVEAHPLAGRYGEAAKSEGGAGALWVIIRRRRSSG